MELRNKIIYYPNENDSPEKEPSNVIEIFLRPGEFYWGDQFTRIRTLLGSCIAICFWHPTILEGGMAHIMLPSRKTPTGKLDARYVDEAMELFINEIKNNNTKLRDYFVKLFGGGIMFKKYESDEVIGQKNIIAARKIVEKFNLNLVSESLGGNVHRRINFELWNGIVHQKKTKHK
jgi:chemotaxis protein CheD